VDDSILAKGREFGLGDAPNLSTLGSPARPALLLGTFSGYRASWFWTDLLAGVTLAAIAVPEQMATAKLANMPAATGLYAFIAGSLVFALLGPNRHISVGADSTIAPVFAAGVAGVVAVGTSEYAHLVSVIAIFVGVVLALSAMMRLGWLSDFLPAPVLAGVLAGIAVQIAVRQLPSVLGVPGAGTTTVGRLRSVYDHRGAVNGWCVAIAAVVLVIVIGAERLDRRLPGALVALVGTTVLVGGGGLTSRGVSTVGSLRSQLPSFGVPSIHWGDVPRLIPMGLTVVFLCIVQTAATARASAGGGDTTGQLNHDLFAVGAGSVLAGLSGSFPVNSSPARTAVVESAGGKSQATGVVAAAVVVAVLAVGGIVKDVPDAALGAILLFVASRLFRVRVFRDVFKFDRLEFLIAAVTVVVVGFVGIEQGVITAAVLALAQRTRMAARPNGSVLGREPGTDHWIPVDIGRLTEQVPGVLVYLPYAPLWYGNATYISSQLTNLISRSGRPIKALVLDADAMSDIDYTAAQELGAFARLLRQQGIVIGVARSSHLVHHDMKHSGLLTEIGADHLFSTVAAAVDGVAPRGPTADG
jgi:SulP family sulfate permease